MILYCSMVKFSLARRGRREEHVSLTAVYIITSPLMLSSSLGGNSSKAFITVVKCHQKQDRLQQDDRQIGS